MVVWWGFEFIGCSPFAFFYCDVHADFPFGCTVTFGRSLKVLGCASEMCVAAFLSEQTTVGSRHGFVGLIGWWHCWYHPTRNVCYAALFVQAVATNTDPIDPGRWRRLFHAGEVHVAPNASFCASRQSVNRTQMSVGRYFFAHLPVGRKSCIFFVHCPDVGGWLPFLWHVVGIGYVFWWCWVSEGQFVSLISKPPIVSEAIICDIHVAQKMEGGGATWKKDPVLLLALSLFRRPCRNSVSGYVQRARRMNEE